MWGWRVGLGGWMFAYSHHVPIIIIIIINNKSCFPLLWPQDATQQHDSNNCGVFMLMVSCNIFWNASLLMTVDHIVFSTEQWTNLYLCLFQYAMYAALQKPYDFSEVCSYRFSQFCRVNYLRHLIISSSCFEDSQHAPLGHIPYLFSRYRFYWKRWL